MEDARARDAVETSRDREDAPTATATETATREDDAKTGMIFQKGDDDEKHVGDAREDDGEARTMARADVERGEVRNAAELQDLEERHAASLEQRGLHGALGGETGVVVSLSSSCS